MTLNRAEALLSISTMGIVILLIFALWDVPLTFAHVAVLAACVLLLYIFGLLQGMLIAVATEESADG